MYYCRYRQSDGYILEINENKLYEDSESKICMTNINNLETHQMYVIEIDENNYLVAHKGYLK